MSESLSLHRATPADAATYARVARDTFFDSYGPYSDPAQMSMHLHRSFSERLQRAELEDPANTVLVARQGDGGWTGFVALRTAEVPDCVITPRPVQIARIYVVRDWHGRGAGPFLMEAALAHAASRGFGSVWLMVWERNLRAQRFYEKQGFVQVGTHPYRFGDLWEDDVVMVRELVTSLSV